MTWSPSTHETPGERAAAVLRAVGVQPVTSAARGRYQRSRPFLPGIRYWSASKPRLRRDLLGVQFFSHGVIEVGAHVDNLAMLGFTLRSPQTGQLTFAKEVAFAPGDFLDDAQLKAARRDIETVFGKWAEVIEPPEGPPRRTFRAFMLASPWANTEIELPERDGHWRDVDL